MESIHGFDFFRLHFDANGNLQAQAEFDDFEQQVLAGQASDAVFIAHGFRNDENDAMELYTGFLGNVRAHLDSGAFPDLANKRFVVAGVFWPSQAFKENFAADGATEALDPDQAVKEEARAKLLNLKTTVANDAQKPKLDRAIELLDQVDGSDQAQDEFVSCVLSLLDGANLGATEGVEELKATDGSKLLDKLGSPIILPANKQDADTGGVSAFEASSVDGPQDGGHVESINSFFGSIFGRIGTFLNLTTWYTMKERSGIVGANGAAKAVRDTKRALPNIRLHLVGHSLGGRLMASCAKSLCADPKLQPDSLTLLEAAFSHYGFSANNGENTPGFFRAVVDDKLVKGPFVSTFSAQDTVVGNIYAIASRLADDNVKAIGDANDKFGGIGRNGAQKTDEAVLKPLLDVGQPYTFEANKILCLDGSGGKIKDHSDVKNPFVTWAFVSAAAETVKPSVIAAAGNG